jgi:hypothetical protein
MLTMLAPRRATRTDSRSPPRSGGTVTRAEPPLRASGFGALMEQESDLKSATESYLRTVNGRRASEIAAMLWEHQMRLETNLTLLEQRYQTPASPPRFRAEPATIMATSGDEFSSAPVTESLPLLAGLLALHRKLLEDIEALLARHGDGQRGEMILAQVGQNHERMAGMITALVGREPIGDPVLPPVVGTGLRQRWTAEGWGINAA